MTAEYGKKISELRLLRWRPTFQGTLDNITAKDWGFKVDMWAMVDNDDGTVLVSIAVPPGRSDVAGYIAACCGNPVRWVTDMDLRDPRADSIDDPDNVLRIEAQAISDHLFAAFSDWLAANKPNGQCNGYTLNDALSYLWFAYCGQLDHQQRGRLLLRFMQIAVSDWSKPGGPEDGDGSLSPVPVK